MKKISLASLTKTFGTFTAVDGIDLSVNEGELLGLLGPSGCGKTTTLNMIAGFEPVTSGRILLDGKDIADLPPHLPRHGHRLSELRAFPAPYGGRERRLRA